VDDAVPTHDSKPVVDPRTSVLDRFRLDDKVVVLTGASSGLGAGFAKSLAGVGATLLLAARRIDRLQELSAKLRSEGSRVEVIQADVAVPADCSAVARRAAEAFGRIDVLVNNAGVSTSLRAEKETSESFAQVIDVNLNGVFWMARSCSAHMPRGSSIVNIASVLAHVAPQFPNASYAASKSGVLGLTRDLANQWTQSRGIRVNALCPGYFETEMTAAGRDRLEQVVREESMIGRFGQQTELDAALVFLASDASSYVTGTSLMVDGGMSVR
jgi:NAD(P)-dependent dehydrogenase (short-subunit alcohol dehydrogenase family)